MTKLEQAATAAINKAVAAMEKGADFMAAEIPEVVQQLLVWHFTVSAISMACFVLLLSGIIYGNYRQIKYLNEGSRSYAAYKKANDDSGYGYAGNGGWEHEVWVPVNTFQIFLLLPLGLLFDLDWLKIWIAPKLYLLEYAASLVKAVT